MKHYAFPPVPQVSAEISGSDEFFPVRRIFCVGCNYADPEVEGGELPFYFTKSAAALIPSRQRIAFPPGTGDFRHEVELVVALGEYAAIFGYACGLDMSRRDLHVPARGGIQAWDLGKDFDNSAVIGPISRDFTPGSQAISLTVNGDMRQSASLAAMAWKVPQIISHLATLYRLEAGDLIFTGTPAGTGPVHPGDVIKGEIEDLAPVWLTIEPRD